METWSRNEEGGNKSHCRPWKPHPKKECSINSIDPCGNCDCVTVDNAPRFQPRGGGRSLYWMPLVLSGVPGNRTMPNGIALFTQEASGTRSGSLPQVGCERNVLSPYLLMVPTKAYAPSPPENGMSSLEAQAEMAIDRDVELMTAVEFVIREKPHQGVWQILRLAPAVTPSKSMRSVVQSSSLSFVVGSLQINRGCYFECLA